MISKILLEKSNETQIEINDVISDNEIIDNYPEHIFVLLINIYINQLKNDEFIYELISKSTYKTEYCNAFVYLLKKEIIKSDDLFFFKIKNLVELQSMLLDVIFDQEDINCIINICRNLENALSFIESQYDKIAEIINRWRNYINDYIIYSENFTLDLNHLKVNSDIMPIYILLEKISKKCKNQEFNFINYDELVIYLIKQSYYGDIYN